MAYWVENRDVTDTAELLKVARESGIPNADQLTEGAFKDLAARTALENETAEAISRGAFGVPGFWIPDANWTDFTGEQRQGRFYWGQDRMHFVEAELLALRNKCSFSFVPGLRSLMPRCIASIPPSGKVRLEFWYDFSSPWAFLAWTQLPRLQRTFGENLEIVMKPFLLGILFRE
jgi:2-hydroxychromene-2-carboxylate isomerase